MKAICSIVLTMSMLLGGVIRHDAFAGGDDLRGPYPLLVTPWTEDGMVDIEVLVREADYVDSCGVGGMIWPTADEVVGNLSLEECREGLMAIARRSVDRRYSARITAVCAGTNSAEAVRLGAVVRSVAKETGARMAILARPPDDATNQTMIAAHYDAFAEEVRMPVIIQTYNGKSPQPDVDMLVGIVRRHPDVYGYIKEESPGTQVNTRMEELLMHPEIKGVFSGWGGKSWVYQGSRIGTIGVISQRPAYASFFAKVYNRLEAGADASDPELADAYAKYLYMANLGDVFTKWGDDAMRDVHLYVLQVLGIFRNRLSRDADGKVVEYEMTDKMKAEVEARMKYCGLPVVAGSSEPTAAELVARAKKGPSLLIAPGTIQDVRRRLSDDPDASKWWRNFRTSTEREFLQKEVPIPERGAQWYHFYSCRKCGGKLKTESATLHVCPACGERHTGWPYDDAALFGPQNRVADAALDCALVYALDGSEEFAVKTSEVLSGLSKVYPGYLPHDINSPKPIDLSKRRRPRCAKAFPQALDESVWLVKLLQAYDIVRVTMSESERRAVEENVFRPAADLIKRDSFGIHNHECWHLSAYGLAGLVLGDVELVYDAINSPTGLKMQLEKGVLSDNCWFEGAWGYHFYAMNALRPFLEALSNLGMPPPRAFKAMFDAPLGQVTPTWQLPAVNDTARVKFRPGDYGDLYEMAWTWWRDPTYAWWLSRTPRMTRSYALHGTPLPVKMDAPQFVSLNYADSGMAIMRGTTPDSKCDMPDNYVAVDYGPHGGAHGHPDKLNLILWGHGEMIAEDPGGIAYGNPRHWEWYKSSLAHNTLVMDGQNQKKTTGKCLYFDDGGKATLGVFDAGEAYPGARVWRAVAIAGDVVLDVVTAESDVEHQWEWAFHARHSVTTSVTTAQVVVPPPSGKTRIGVDTNGAEAWSWTERAREGLFHGGWKAAWRRSNGDVVLGVVQVVRDGKSSAPVDGALRTAIAGAQPPPQKLSLVVPRVRGRSVVFASVLLPGRSPCSALIERVEIDAGGSINVKAVVNGRSYDLNVCPDGSATLAF